jgi:hypothetical protein
MNARGPFAIEKPNPGESVRQGRSTSSTERSFVSSGTSDRESRSPTERNTPSRSSAAWLRAAASGS